MGAEEWRDAVGFEGRYEVSNLGRVKSLPRQVKTAHGATRFHAGRVMKPVVDQDGYPRVKLHIDGKHFTRKVHRLVCEAFHGPPNALHREADHVNGDVTDARAANLRWVSRLENMHFRKRLPQRSGSSNGFARLTEQQARRILRAKGGNAAMLAAEHGVSKYAIYDIWRGRRWAHLGAEQ